IVPSRTASRASCVFPTRLSPQDTQRCMACCAGIPTPLGIMAVSTTGIGRWQKDPRDFSTISISTGKPSLETSEASRVTRWLSDRRTGCGDSESETIWSF
ncbi:hypothetical protein PISMIDRAFT_683581, partial [Pisolithus microcarpus 441]